MISALILTITLAAWTPPSPEVDFEDALARAEAANRMGQYAQALNAMQTALTLAPEEAREDLLAQQSLYIAAQDFPVLGVHDHQPSQIEGAYDLANLLRVPSQVNNLSVEAIIDTGAEINVIRESLAREAGLFINDKDGVIVGTVTDNVTGHAAYADHLTLGSMVFENVTFLVLSDEQLTFSDGAYVVDAIIGLPVLSAAQRMGWSEAGIRLHLGETPQQIPAQAQSLFWHQDGVGLFVRYGETQGRAFFDSGASRTLFRDGIRAHLDETTQSALTPLTRTRTGVGGSYEVEAHRAERLSLTIGGVAWLSEPAIIEAPDEDHPGEDWAAIGSDVIRHSQSFSLDFTQMRYARTPMEE